MIDEKYFMRLKRMAGVTDESKDELLWDELELAKDFINNRRGFTPNLYLDIEPKYLNLMVEMALAAWSKRGAEGELAHAENGISRTYETANIYPTSLVNQVIPKVKSIVRVSEYENPYQK